MHKFKIPMVLTTLLLLLVFFPLNVISVEPTACDRAYFDCIVETGGFWFWQVACVIGWAWCVTYAEPFAR
ncbi:MAG: hypothetical protein BWY77_00206 [bacterium ADurb.Bin431]|nr:MAG: hypothetical protein BWY77_00206 [bacterium ADurb.Bin431]HOH08809.1 hypothetical protein [bacterium]HOY45678.1 hypothetical protein [bacterium]HPG81650.1 hypothetical protein [bacterium]HPM57961.1 hypothetical protein [bacterium]